MGVDRAEVETRRAVRHSFRRRNWLAGLLWLLALQVSIAQEIEKGCPRTNFAGRELIEAGDDCVVAFEDIAVGPSGELWVADGFRILRFPSSFGENSKADAVVGKPGFFTLESSTDPQCSLGSSGLCWFDQVRLVAADHRGRIWAATNRGLARFSPPFGPRGSPADFVLSPAGEATHIVVDDRDNLWVGINGCLILRYSEPIAASSRPDLVIGARALGACEEPVPGPRQFLNSRGFTFGLDGTLLVSDNASNRLLIFDPPFQTYMAAARAIGQVDLNAFEPRLFDDGGIAFVGEPEVDALGRLWLIHNGFFVSMYRPSWTTGQVRQYWFDYFNSTATGPQLPSPLKIRYQKLAVLPSGALLLFGGRFQGVGERVAKVEVPVVEDDAVVNAATFQGSVSPGGIYSAFGTELGFPGGLVGRIVEGQLETAVGKTQVRIAGSPAPIFFASGGQINFQAPFDLDVSAPVRFEVLINGFRGPSAEIRATPSDPGIFLLEGGVPAVVSETGQVGLLASGRYATAYATGLGAVEGTIATGEVTPSGHVFPVSGTTIVRVDGNEARVLFAGLAPGFVGLYQVNFEVPPIESGSHNVAICRPGACSPPVSVVVQ